VRLLEDFAHWILDSLQYNNTTIEMYEVKRSQGKGNVKGIGKRRNEPGE
jgi:hypothetical protein